MTRIAIDATPFLFPCAGVGRVTKELFDAMQELPKTYDFTLYVRRLFGKMSYTDNMKSCTIRRLRLPQQFEPLISRLKMIERFAPADLYHATDHYLPLHCTSPAVVTIHDLLFLLRPNPKWEIHKRQARTVPAFAASAKHIITCSEHTKKDIINTLNIEPEKITVIPWAVKTSIFYRDENQSAVYARLKKRFAITRPYFLAVACSAGRKNTPFLIKAYEALESKSPNNDLVMVCPPPKKEDAQMSTPLLKTRVHCTGRVSDDELRDLYNGATALVYPSLYEGFGLPVLESLACGTPVITSDCSSIPEVGGDIARYINPEDMDSLLYALKCADSDETFLPNANSCIEHASKFSWKQTAMQTLDVYRRCIEAQL